MASKKRPVVFSFTAMMGIIAQRSLGDLDEDLELLSWLNGGPVSLHSVNDKYYAIAQERLIAQFPMRFKGFHLDSCKPELDKLMENPGDDEMRKMVVSGWLGHMASRTRMDIDAYYVVKKGRKAM